jgi:hypothetical protein
VGKTAATVGVLVVANAVLVYLALAADHYVGPMASYVFIGLAWLLYWAVRRYGPDRVVVWQLEAARARMRCGNPLTLDEYRHLVGALPPPTAEQQRSFAEYVAEAHSWYKHLPPYPPGAPFTFFIDPFAGCDCVAGRGGRLRFVAREAPGFHYSAIPTRRYRERYGYLNFSSAERPTVILPIPGRMVMPTDDAAAVADGEGRLRPLPRDVQESGAVRLTAAVHPAGARFPYWDRRTKLQPQDIAWPEETGGCRVVERLFESSRAMRDHLKSDLEGWLRESAVITTEFGQERVDPALKELLRPERERQQREMVAAMRRVCALIYG